VHNLLKPAGILVDKVGRRVGEMTLQPWGLFEEERSVPGDKTKAERRMGNRTKHKKKDFGNIHHSNKGDDRSVTILSAMGGGTGAACPLKIAFREKETPNKTQSGSQTTAKFRRQKMWGGGGEENGVMTTAIPQAQYRSF